MAENIYSISDERKEALMSLWQAPMGESHHRLKASIKRIILLV